MGVSKHTEASKHKGHPKFRGIQTYGGVQTYRETYGGHPNIKGVIQTYGASKHTGGIQTYRGASKCMETYGYPLSLTKHAFFLLCMYRGIQTWGAQPFCIILNYICHLVFFLILNILSIFQNISLHFALCVDRNSLLQGI